MLLGDVPNNPDSRSGMAAKRSQGGRVGIDKGGTEEHGAKAANRQREGPGEQSSESESCSGPTKAWGGVGQQTKRLRQREGPKRLCLASASSFAGPHTRQKFAERGEE